MWVKGVIQLKKGIPFLQINILQKRHFMKQRLLQFLSVPPLDYYFKLKGFLQKWKAKSAFRSYLKRSGNPRLTIGCGRNAPTGWLNTDLRPQKGAPEKVLYLNAAKTFPFAEGTFDCIYSEHIFEHLTFKDSCNMLKECYRILKPGGIMRMALPHADFLFDMYQHPEKRLNKAYVNLSMEHYCKDIAKALGENKNAHVYVVNDFYRNWNHQMLHNLNSLTELVGKHGFVDIEQKEVGESTLSVFQNLERQGRLSYPADLYNLQTMVIEAKK